MNILAIVAHMDDAETHCGGVLRKYIEAGHKVYILLTSNGNKGTFTLSKEETTKLRQEEQRSACKILGAEEPLFLNYEDNMMEESSEFILDLINEIRKVNPSVIFTHWLNDGSNDHRVTANAIVRSMISLRFKNMPVEALPMEEMPSLFFFDSDGGVDFLPEIYIDITDVMDIKIRAFLEHKSQTEYDPRYLEDVILLSKFRGFQAGYEYAECFISHKAFGFMPKHSLLP